MILIIDTEDRQELMRYIKSFDMALALSDISVLRRKNFETSDELFDTIYSILDDNYININELIN